MLVTGIFFTYSNSYSLLVRFFGSMPTLYPIYPKHEQVWQFEFTFETEVFLQFVATLYSFLFTATRFV